jgi:hypothetical protein
MVYMSKICIILKLYAGGSCPKATSVAGQLAAACEPNSRALARQCEEIL